jgi:hypothetical protein
MLTDEERRASYEAIDLARLPDDGIECEPARWWSTRPCGCRHCRGDWRRIAVLSVEVLARGIDPLDFDAIRAFSRQKLRWSRRDCGWLLSLFCDPVVVAPTDESYTNGRHRVHAMRLARVKMAVIYTKAGERGRRGP